MIEFGSCKAGVNPLALTHPEVCAKEQCPAEGLLWTHELAKPYTPAQPYPWGSEFCVYFFHAYLCLGFL